jgi:hypothetical protein
VFVVQGLQGLSGVEIVKTMGHVVADLPLTPAR